jgi:ketosteroid isomerase-like protein
MRRFSALAACFIVVPTLAFAHVTVAPREAKPGVEQVYTVRVPTEGQVSTLSVYLEVPDGVTVMDVPHREGATHEVKKDGNRIGGITWTKEIPPKLRAEFVFKARNPAAPGQITWKVQQRFADGKATDWTPGTKLIDTPVMSPDGSQSQPGGDATAIETWLKGYDAAFNAKDLEKLAAFYHADVTIYEGGGINNGWADYRDNHLGPELKQLQNPQFAHSDLKVTPLAGGNAAYATARYTLKAQMGDRAVDSAGLATYVLVKDASGAWKIRHSHTSSRARRPTP